MKNSGKAFTILTGVLGGVLGLLKVVSSLKGGGDLGCDWYCDNCGARMNDQLGFHAGGTWECTSCGYENDVSEDNILSTHLTDDGLEVTDFPSYELEDPEDY